MAKIVTKVRSFSYKAQAVAFKKERDAYVRDNWSGEDRRRASPATVMRAVNRHGKKTRDAGWLVYYDTKEGIFFT